MNPVIFADRLANMFAEINANVVVISNVANGNVVTVCSVRLFNSVDKFVFHRSFLYREPARAVVFYLEPDTKVQQKIELPKVFPIFLRKMCIFFDFGEKIRPDRGIFALITPKINRYACSKSSRWLSLGPIRKDLPDKGTGRKTGPGHLCVRLSGKARAKQKEIGTARIVRENPYLCRVFLPRIALSVS